MSEIHKALIAAQQEMQHAELDSENPHFGSKYASLKSVINAVKNHLNDHGIAFLQSSEAVEGAVVVTTTLLHENGETLSGGPVRVPMDKQNAHGYGSALTYAKRYSLAMVCGISADVDNDGNFAVTDLVEYNQHVRELWDSIAAIKQGISDGDNGDESGYQFACEAWSELTNTQKQSIWLAPTKGGIWTTAERQTIKEVLPKYLDRPYRQESASE